MNVNEKIGTPVKVTDPNSWGMPNISLSGSTLSSFGNDANGPFTIDNKVYQVVDNFSWIRGKHSLRFGGEYRYNQFLQIGNEFARARFTANGSFTGNGNTLTGGYNGRGFPARSHERDRERGRARQERLPQHEWGIYIDDTWKVTPKLTVNWGLRWEVAQPLLDKFGLEPNFQLKQPLPSIANDPNLSNHPVFVRTGTGDFYEGLDFRFTGPVQLARDGRLGNRMIKTDYNNFAPRLGIAYSPSSTVVDPHGFRHLLLAGEQELDLRPESRHGRPRQSGDRSARHSDADLPELHQHHPTAGEVRAGADLGRRSSTCATLTRMQYLFNVQRTLGSNSTVEVGYTGNQSRKVAYLVNANAPLPGITTFDAREPYPEWHGIQYLNGDGIANYNALSAKLTQRFGPQPDDAVQLHVVEGARREQRDPRHRHRLHAGESALPLVRLRSGRVQRAASLRDFGSVLRCRSAKGSQVPESRRRGEPGGRRLAGEHDHDGAERHVDQSGLVGFGGHGRRLPALEPAELRRRAWTRWRTIRRPTATYVRERSAIRWPANSATAGAIVLIAPSPVECGFLDDEGLPDHRAARAAVPHGDVQRSESSGLGPSERGLGNAERRRRRSASGASARPASCGRSSSR